MSIHRLLDRVRQRHRDDNGSMAMYLTIAVMGLALAALLVPMIVTSSKTTRSDTSRVHALDAAQAGINVMLGKIRAAQIEEAGTSTLLPCEPTSGVVNSAGQAAYTVTIDYYMADPVAVPGASKMSCVPGYGTYDPVSDTFTPKFARITATGTDGPAVNGSTKGRTLATTYVFRTTNSNIVGGRIRIYPGSSSAPELCMDAGSATPTAGTLVRLQACATPPKDQQIFAYRPDLTLQLLSSMTSAYPNGLCLDTAPPPTNGGTIVLRACGAPGSPPYTQQWSFNDQGGYTAAVSSSSTSGALSSQCISAGAQSPGVQLTLDDCSKGSTSSPTQAWIPSPAVGAGAAEAPQLVNFYEFGRCLDVTGQNPDANHLIDYPCKQNPFSGAVAWNQKFALPGIAAGGTSATGQIRTTRGTTTYCLTSPGVDGGYVTVQVCSDTNTRMIWTVYNGSSALAYSAKYTIVDNGGRCLGLTDPVSGEQWSAIDVEPCTGATEQKWNATANLAASVLQDLDEL